MPSHYCNKAASLRSADCKPNSLLGRIVSLIPITIKRVERSPSHNVCICICVKQIVKVVAVIQFVVVLPALARG